MGDENDRPPLVRRVPGATRAGPAGQERRKPPELPEEFRQRIQAVVSAAHAQAARELEAGQEQAEQPDKPGRHNHSARSARRTSPPADEPKPPNGLLQSVVPNLWHRREDRLSDEDAEFDTAPVPRLTASGAIANPAAPETGARPAHSAQSGGEARPDQVNGRAPAVRQEQGRGPQRKHAGRQKRAGHEDRERAAAQQRAGQEEERAAQERARQEQERAAQERARQEQERAAQLERERAERERAAQERARQERERAAKREQRRATRQERAAERVRAVEQKRAARQELARALQERARQEQERAAQLEQERARQEEERAAKERIRLEQELEDRQWAAQRRARLEQQREEAEERARQERERAEAEESARQEQERAARLEQERVRQEEERARLEKQREEERARQERERAEAKERARQQRERAEAERRARQEQERAARLEQERMRQEARLEKQREEKRARQERERQQAEQRARQEQERAEAKERARQEQERAAQLEQERMRQEEERARLEKQREEERARQERERQQAEERARQERRERAEAEKRARQERKLQEAEKRARQKQERREAEERSRQEREAAAAEREHTERRVAAAVLTPPARVARPEAGERTGPRRYRTPAAVAAAVALLAGGSVFVARSLHSSPHTRAEAQISAAARKQAAAWIAQQVNTAAIVSCDPVMCRALKAHGVPADDLRTVGPGTPTPPGSVVVATAAVRKRFGSSLTSDYAPAVLASFGSGNARIQVRVIAQHGAAAYLAQFKTDKELRKTAGAALLAPGPVTLSPVARSQLASGQVDSRLIVLLSWLAPVFRLDVAAFGDSGPGATAGMPLRSLTVTGSMASLQSILTYVRTHEIPPYLPEHTQIMTHRRKSELVIEFLAPSPLELFLNAAS